MYSLVPIYVASFDRAWSFRNKAYTNLDSFLDLGYDEACTAAVIHKLLRSPKSEQLYLKYANDILGEVRTHKLSRTHAHCPPRAGLTLGISGHLTMDGQQRRMSIGNNKKLVDDICRYGLCIKQCERKVKSLNIKQSNIELEMSNLGAYIGLDFFHDTDYDKDMVVAKIEGKADSVAAVIHKLLRSPKSEQLYLKYAHDILGTVALLGEVRTHKLSSMLSTYLGEDQMLALVCKSCAAARALENYQMDGNVNCSSALDILAAKLGISIKGRYLVICLEDIRPYTRGVGRDPQRELAFPHPTLSNGKTPPGFLGYAVNMIFPPAEHLQFRTASGHDLQETLFYRLLGKLQVYQSREYLYMARFCIEDGAVSLDGGMIRGNGVVSVGSEEPHILFPVKPLSPENVERLKRMEDLKLELKQTQDQMQEEVRTRESYKMKLTKKLQYKRQIDAQLELSPGMYKSDMDISGASG